MYREAAPCKYKEISSGYKFLSLHLRALWPLADGPMSKKTRRAPAQKVQDGSALTELGQQIAEWKELTAWMETAKVKERELREQIVAGIFPDGLVEGTNKLESEDGNATVKQPYNYKLDETALDAVMPELGKLNEDLLDVSGPDALIRYKPALNLERYRLLSEEEQEIFAQALTITPGLPSLELALPSDVTTPIMDAYEEAKKEATIRTGKTNRRATLGDLSKRDAMIAENSALLAHRRKNKKPSKTSFHKALAKGKKSRPAIAALSKKAPARKKLKQK
jgi:hypothetical protein